MRDPVKLALLALPFLAICNMLVTGNSLIQFLRATPEIKTWQHMEAFKRMVAKQMYSALLQIVLVGLPGVIFIAGWASKILTLMDFLLYVLLPSIVIVIGGLKYKTVEHRAKNLPVSPEFAEEYNRIITTWLRKAVPDWKP